MELMKEDSLTSEEKLLRLIRKKEKSPGAPPLPFQENRTTISPDLPDETQSSGNPMDALALSIRVLAVMACIILGFVLNKYARMKPLAAQSGSSKTQVAEDLPSSPSEKEEELSIASIEVRPFDSYKQTMEGRDIFQAPWEKPVEAPVSGISGSELIKQLKLVGILLDKDPKAIVEDLGTQQTFFVSPGERIGNAVVQEIRQDKVILIFGQEKVELVP